MILSSGTSLGVSVIKVDCAEVVKVSDYLSIEALSLPSSSCFFSDFTPSACSSDSGFWVYFFSFISIAIYLFDSFWASWGAAALSDSYLASVSFNTSFSEVIIVSSSLSDFFHRLLLLPHHIIYPLSLLRRHFS